MEHKVSSQLLKGFLQGILLILLAEEANYGYGISQRLVEVGLESVPKGTIYPLLTSMEKRGLVKSESRPSTDGPSRKYYETTDEGLLAKQEFLDQWGYLVAAMGNLTKEEQA
ncbi:PadR family transcriptional regulator [Fructobacillus sp. M2-14]|uniref:PadR family transcriptional regulator n=1 Tax=Fructobacillus broussonetiae TaxID=2713173 RepID=A0ABS5QYF7_9LACO|nr:PadR family transcriptional regulator [Fructobacillus broussonetiae]MBS9338141.1 PadR family transcriptional regulator [Fructobacillus broussonetiae]